MMMQFSSYLYIFCLMILDMKIAQTTEVQATSQPHITTLKELCKDFHIPPENCSCRIFKIKDPLIKSLCDVDKPVIVTHSTILPNIFGSLAVLFAIIGLLGNVLVILVSWSVSGDITTCQKLVTMLAVCDLVSGVFQFIKSLRNLWTSKWIYGFVLCKLFNGVEQLGTCLSMGLILLICVERYVGITRPFDGGLSPRNLKIGLFTNIALGVCAVIPCLIFFSNFLLFRKRSTGYGNSDMSCKNNNGAFSFTNDGFV